MEALASSQLGQKSSVCHGLVKQGGAVDLRRVQRSHGVCTGTLGKLPQEQSPNQQSHRFVSKALLAECFSEQSYGSNPHP